MATIICASAAAAGARTVGAAASSAAGLGHAAGSSARAACFIGGQCSTGTCSLSVTPTRGLSSGRSLASSLSTDASLGAAVPASAHFLFCAAGATTASCTGYSRRQLHTAHASRICGYASFPLAGRAHKVYGTRTDSKLGLSLDEDNSSGTAGTKRTLKTKSKGKGGKISAKERGGPKRYKSKHRGLLRADRVLSNRGVGTRSQTHKLLRSRRISVLDAETGKLVQVLGPSEKIDPDATLYLDGNELPGPPPPILIYHKPKYVLSAMEDRDGRSHLGEKLEGRYAKAGMHPVGRLDYETTGLILFSSSGDLTQRLLHPRRGVEKEYVASVEGDVDEEALRERLGAGVETSEGTHVARLLEVTQPARLLAASSTEAEVEEGGSDDDDRRSGSDESEAEGRGETEQSAAAENFYGVLTDVRLVVTEGKHRMVRRMLANCGHPVVELRRERHGVVRLDDLPVGKFRDPTEEEIEWAENLLK